MDIVAVKDSELERYVTKIMLEIGVPAHLKGYHYLRDAIILSGKDMEVVSSVTKLLYPTIAKHFKTTDQKVERAIRNAIETSAKSIRHISWFEVVKTTGHVTDGKVAHFQVTLKIGFRIEDE